MRKVPQPGTFRTGRLRPDLTRSARTTGAPDETNGMRTLYASATITA